MKKLTYFFAVALLLASTSLFAQDSNQGKFGLGIDGVDSPNLLAKYYVSDEFATEFMLGFDIYSPGGDAPRGQTKVTGTAFRVGLDGLYNFKVGKVTPYIGAEVLYQNMKEGGFFAVEPDAKSELFANLVLGAEYFIDNHFSFGIKHRIGADIKFSRDIPKEETDTYFKTSTQLTARFYF
ncbi:MAG: outer membrane beta-barrel protein [Melioribacteraceae bacterium]